MEITIETKELQQALSVAAKLVEKISTVTLKTYKEGVKLYIISPDHYFSSDLVAKVHKKGKFTIQPELLLSILRSRSTELDFVVKDNRLAFKSHSARLAGKDISLLGDEELRDPVTAEKQALQLPRKMQRKILHLLDVCAFQSFYGKVLVQTLFSKEGKVNVLCVDDACASIGTVFTSEKVNIPKVDLPAEYSERLKYLPGDSFKFAFVNDLMIVDTTVSHVELKMLQPDKISTLEKALALEKPKVLCSFEVDSFKLKQELDGITITYEKGVPITMTLKNRTLEFVYKTSSGIFTNGINVENIKGQCSFHVDLEIFRNLLNKTIGKIVVKIREATVTLCFEPEQSTEVRFIIAKLN